MQATEDLLAELLEQWESAMEAGLPMTPEEVCRNHPDSVEAFRSLLTKLGPVHAMLQGTVPFESTAEVTGPEDGGRYRVNCYHDRGGQAVIFAAEDTELRRTVALKWMPALAAMDPVDRHRFITEAELTARLEHPGIVPIYGLGEDENGQPYYAMRMIQGENLSDIAKRFHSDRSGDRAERSVQFRRLLQHFVAVCTTVAYAHARGVLHRDLKPANIRIGPFGETLVLDWGLAKSVAVAQSPQSETQSNNADRADAWSGTLTLAGTVMGSPSYMSPEQAAGNWEIVGPATDVYGLGATLYVLLCGRAPFQGETVNSILDQVRRGAFPPPRSIDGTVSKALNAICLKAMALRPEDRYRSVTDLIADVENHLADEPVQAWREPWFVRARRWISRHRTLATSVAASFLVGAVALAGITVVLDQKNRELTRANQTAEANYQQSHASLRNIVDMAVNGRTLGNNAALLPVRREILQRAIENAEGLRGRDQANEQVLLELALLQTSLGQVEFLLGNNGEASALFQSAMELCQDRAAEGELNWRHALALAQFHFTQTIPAPGGHRDKKSLSRLNEAGSEFASLTREGKFGRTVQEFDRRSIPAVCLAAIVAELEQPTSEQQEWAEIAEAGIQRLNDLERDVEIYAQTVRGRMWYLEATRLLVGKPDFERGLRQCALSRAAFDRALAVSDSDQFRDLTLWSTWESEALRAWFLAQSGKVDEAITALRAACREQESLLPSLERISDHMSKAWGTIDPQFVPDRDGAKVDSGPLMQQLQLCEHLMQLAELMELTHAAPANEYARGDRLMTAIAANTALPNSQVMRVARMQGQLAAGLMREPRKRKATRQWAQAALDLLEDREVSTSDRLDALFTRCLACTILGETSESIEESARWLRKTDSLRPELRDPKSPVPARQLSARAATTLSEAMAGERPVPREAIWQTAQEALQTMASLRKEDPQLASQEQTRRATHQLVGVSLGWAGELLQQQPIPREEATRICTPAREALKEWITLAGTATDDENKWMKLLNLICEGKYLD